MAKKTDTKSKPAAPTKSVAAPAPTKKTVAPKAKPATKITKSKATAYTPDDVALRAYFIAEKRRTHGLPGSEHQDWLEAERQLAAESKRGIKAKKA